MLFKDGMKWDGVKCIFLIFTTFISMFFYCYDTEEELGLDSTLVSPVKMQVEVLELDLTCKEREEGAAFVGNLLLQ